ncbi:MAG: hypothetical protein V4813_11920 [Gemmatimonadota bacterium]
MYALTAAACVLLALPLRAQADDTIPSSASSWALGGTVMMPRATGGANLALLGIGLSAGTLRPNIIGGDLAFVVSPTALAFGALIGGVRANLALPVAVGGSTLLVPSAGVSLLGGAASGGFGGVAGVNGTMAVIFFSRPLAEPGPSLGLRIAVASHRFGQDGDASVRMLEVGFVKRAQ